MTNDATKVIRTASGAIRCAVEDGVLVARGVRYAEPPIGERRFEAPARADGWSGVVDALEFGPECPQNPAMLSSPGARQDEDCLFLNVWAPDGDPDAGRPVLFWIHGGGFTSGSGSTPWYDGTALARRGVVVVTINYRLGGFGFLHLPGRTNAGMRDQVLALEWVRDHIDAFGGNPDRVTAFGESAGAMSVGTHLGIPASTGLFRRAILQSGACRNVSTRDQAAAILDEFLDAVGVTAPDDLLEAPVAAILAAQTTVTQRVGANLLPFQPMIDGDLVPRDPLDVVASGSVAGIDMVIGTTTDEAKLFTAFVPRLVQSDHAAVARRIERVVGHDPTDLIATYRSRLGDAPPSAVFDAAFTDRVFRIPAIELAELQVDAGASVWMYEFAERSDSFDGALGACHAIDVPFAWDNIDARGVRMLLGDRTDARRALAGEVADRWVHFAETGEPVGSGPEWPTYDRERRTTLRFATGSTATVSDPLGEERRLWPVRAASPTASQRHRADIAIG